MSIRKDSVIKKLKKVLDPELSISLWDLGLIYDVDISQKGSVKITMTLTSIGCPLYSVIESEIIENVKSVKGVKEVTVDLTFEPMWSMEKISPSAKKKLGL